MPVRQAPSSGGGEGTAGFTSMNQGVLLEAFIMSTYATESNSFITKSHSGSKIQMIPFSFSHDYTFDRVGVNIATIGGSAARLGLFQADMPNNVMNLITDFGTVATGTTGKKEIAISQTIPAGNYYIGVIGDGTIGYTSINDPVNGYSLHGTSSYNAVANCVIIITGQSSVVSGGFAASYAISKDDISSADPISPWLKRSA